MSSSFTAWSIPAFLVGLAIVLAVGSSILRTLVVPRGVRSKLSAGVLTAIHGRSETRSYIKGVKGGSSEASLSPEELQAISYALKGVSS